MKGIAQSLQLYRPHQPFFERLLPAYVESADEMSSLFDGGIRFFGFHLDAKNADRLHVFPDGCLDLVICCYPRKPSANICGSLIHRRQGLFIRSDCDYFVIRFLPGFAEPFFKHPVNEFTENEIPVETVLPHAAQLLESVAIRNSFHDRISAFLDFYLRHYSGGLEVPGLVLYAADTIIKSRGGAQISQLAADTGCSTRYLLNLFQRHLGVSPKLFSRVIRFQSALDELSQPGADDALEKIMNLGYFDQNHFIREFKEFGDETPRRYLKLFPPVSVN